MRRSCVDCGKQVVDHRSQRCGDCSRRAKGQEIRDRVTPPNPSGICMCGCGGTTPVATRTYARQGIVRGQHLRFIKGHQRNAAISRPYSEPEYEVAPDTGCWIWQRKTHPSGYGYKGSKRAHRWFYEQRYGPLPKGVVLDHICRNRACVNPDHLEPCSVAVNVRRGTLTRLSADQVEEIRSMLPSMTQRAIAAKFSVSQGTISAIARGKTWR